MTPTVKASVTKDRLAAALKDIQQLIREKVLVGIPQATAGRRGEPITNAALGYIHERGAPEQNIPARPFLVPGVASIKEKLAEHFKRTARGAVRSGAQNVGDLLHSGLEAAGTLAVSGVKRYLTTAAFAPLQPSTVRNRRRRGKGSRYRRKATTAADVRPLIDTGQLRNAVTYVIRSR